MKNKITADQIANYIIKSPTLLVDSDYEYHVIYDFEKNEFTYDSENFYDIVEIYAKADYLVEHEKTLNEKMKEETGNEFESENYWNEYKADHPYIESEIKDEMRNYVDETETEYYAPFMELCSYIAYKLNKEI